MTLEQFIWTEGRSLDVRVEFDVAMPGKVRYVVRNFHDGNALQGWDTFDDEIEGYGSTLEQAFNRFYVELTFARREAAAEV